jgi:hypothetical protein
MNNNTYRKDMNVIEVAGVGAGNALVNLCVFYVNGDLIEACLSIHFRDGHSV